MILKLDIQTVGVSIDHDMQQRIKSMIQRLRRHISDINFVDVYFRNEKNHSTGKRTVGVRLGIPGNDVFASMSGVRWISLLKTVEEKLERQLKRRKK